MKTSIIAVGWMSAACGLHVLTAEDVWRAFELRYASDAPGANGETDFRGETEVFDTPQRLEYLRTYERAAGRFFENPDWNKRVVPDDEAKQVLTRIKPQPLPEVRDRMLLRTWRWLGFNEGIIEREKAAIGQWAAVPESSIEEGGLRVGETSLSHVFDPQSWRFRLRWTASVEDNCNATFRIGNAMTVGFGGDGTLFFESRGGGENLRPL